MDDGLTNPVIDAVEDGMRVRSIFTFLTPP